MIFIIGFFLLLQSCTALMPLADDMEKIADDTAIKIEVSREALQHDTNMKVTIDVMNKEVPVK